MEEKRGRGRPRGFGETPSGYKDRFQKFYFSHRERLNDERRNAYDEKKRKGICVRCSDKAVRDSVFCRDHRERTHKN
ncbi:hypothetical protein GOV07_04775 [Candidatus Woesearchaeota archaeon]|nr:hypothetical protein [Candidatus Woesearchaeota archaeon]